MDNGPRLPRGPSRRGRGGRDRARCGWQSRGDRRLQVEALRLIPATSRRPSPISTAERIPMAAPAPRYRRVTSVSPENWPCNEERPSNEAASFETIWSPGRMIQAGYRFCLRQGNWKWPAGAARL
jgi:hypothetical protein